jgi:16S rRNA (guanine(527)-N(7))-methyltransferase RsmG
MDALLKRCGINLSAGQLKQLWAYHQLLRRHDAELNLTRIRNFENMVVKLYADSILPALHAPLPSPLLDLGTGPGMPGIPLKIFRPQLHILLAESRQNRIDFLKTAVSTLDLPGLDVVERGIAPDYDRPVAGVITRAVEPIADTLARVAGCLVQNGMVFFMKGPPL